MNQAVLRGLLALTVFAGIALALVYREQIDIATLQQGLAHAGAAAPLLFMLIYALGTVLFLPGSVLTLAGGALFGPVWGTLYNLTGATLGATLAFLLARYLAADWVERKTAGMARRLKAGVEQEGWRFVAFVRLVPLFPFNLLNYALGLTRIRLGHYIIASWLCMLPGAIAYTYLGYAGREALAGGEGLIQKALLALALLAAVAFLPRLIERLRQGPMLDVEALRAALQDDAPPLLLDVRDAVEFVGEQGHIAAALNIPLADLGRRFIELGEDRQRPIAIVCRTDVRSRKAAALLAQHGFAQVQVVRGGMTAWNQWNFPRQG
ncbi:MAG: VTT domain-containing protein [Gammaproteobacteria bacterium]|nr:VTT domain-containing protein [Gammaproteobacteria bacterium]